MTNRVTPDPAGLLLLADRVEAASYPERELMCAAFKAVFPEVSAGALDAIDAWDAGHDRFCSMLDVGAFESAALMLLPVEQINMLDFEMSWDPSNPAVWPAASARWYPPRKEGKDWHAMVVSAATLSLTICSAALRLRAQYLASVGGEG